jgi:Tfp pilus assembly protein PilF
MFEQAARLAPQDYQVRGNLADAYRRAAGKSGLAMAEYAKAAELARASVGVNPESAVSRAALAYYLVRQGLKKEAASELETALSVASSNLNTHLYAALVYKEFGDLPAAAVETGKAIEAGLPTSLLRADPEFQPILQEPGLAAAIGAAQNGTPPETNN